jgi:CDP-diacylglycerol pyrophosphatase
MRSAKCLEVLIAIGAAVMLASSPVRAAEQPQTNPNVLWLIVHAKCVPAQVAQGVPAPCQIVDLDGHYAVLEDLRGNTRHLRLPTDPISGIEIKLQGPTLGIDPFRRLAERLKRPASEMAGQSLSVLGAEFKDGKPGFYLLDSPAVIHGASSEDVLDRDCRVLQQPAAQGAN